MRETQKGAAPAPLVPDLIDAFLEAHYSREMVGQHPEYGPYRDEMRTALTELVADAVAQRDRLRDAPSVALASKPLTPESEALHESNHHGSGGPCRGCSPCPYHGEDCPKAIRGATPDASQRAEAELLALRPLYEVAARWRKAWESETASTRYLEDELADAVDAAERALGGSGQAASGEEKP